MTDYCTTDKATKPPPAQSFVAPRWELVPLLCSAGRRTLYRSIGTVPGALCPAPLVDEDTNNILPDSLSTEHEPPSADPVAVFLTIVVAAPDLQPL